jgi:hypothetical protein
MQSGQSSVNIDDVKSETKAKKLEKKSDELEIQLSFRESGVTNTGLFVLKFPSSADAKLFSQSIAEPLPEGMMVRGQEIIIKLYKNTHSAEYNFIMGTNQAVLNFLNGLGLEPDNTKTYQKTHPAKKIKSLQVEYTYLGGLIKSYDALTPHTLPEDLQYDAFYQRHKIYFTEAGLRYLKQGLPLFIPQPGSVSPAQPYSRTVGTFDFFQTLPAKPSTSLVSKLYHFITEQPFSSPSFPGVEFRIAKKGALVLTFDSETDAQYAAFKIGQFKLDGAESKALAGIINTQIPDNADLMIPFINKNELRLPLHKNTSDEYCIYLGNNCENFLKLFAPTFDKQQVEKHDIIQHFFPDFEQNVIKIKNTKKLNQLNIKSDQIFKFIFPLHSHFLSENKKFITQYIRNIQSSSRINQRAKNVMMGLLEFAAEKQIDLAETAKQTHLVIPLRLKHTLNDFLLYKKTVEPKIFEKMTVADFIKRLMTARPAVFVGSHDRTEYWPDQQASDCLTYDEIPIAAMLISSSYTHFINSGGMQNNGKLGAPGTYQEDGICMNVVGTRLEKPLKCEYQHIIITQQQNTPENGYGQDADKKNHHTSRNAIWANLYEVTHLPSYKEVNELKKDPRYIQLGNNHFFNLEIYIKRTYMLLEIYLLEANQRAQKAGKQAYIHLMGFGNGAWSTPEICPMQNRLFPLLCDLVLQNNLLENVSDIHFSYISLKDSYKQCGAAGHGETSTSGENEVKMWFYDRPPTAKLEGEHQNKLLVRLYQGDGGCSPGNEFWIGSIAGSGEPAAIANSYVGLYQNPRINTDWLNEMKAGNHNLYRGKEKLPDIESLLKLDWQSMVPTASQKSIEKKIELALKDKKDSLPQLPTGQEPVAQRSPVSDPPPGVLSRLSFVSEHDEAPSQQQHIENTSTQKTTVKGR